MANTDYSELKTEIESNGHNPEQSLSTEEKIKAAVEKYRPYVKRLWAARWKLVLINGIVAILSAAILLLFVKNYYDSTITVLPDYGNSASNLLGSFGGFAAMAGINVGETVPTEVYNNLIYSESILYPVIYAKYKTKEFDKPVNLIEYYEIEPKTVDKGDPRELQERDKFLQIIDIFNKNILTSSVDRQTTIMTATIRTDDPFLSSTIANNIAISLDEYVRTKRKSNAKEQRIYVEKRLEQVKDSLTLFENKLKNFREQNRTIAQSPQLLLAEARMLREVEIEQKIYIELTKQMELVKLEEIKDAPIINVREEANIPIKKAGPHRSIYITLILMFSVVISFFYIIYIEKIREFVNFTKLSLK